MDGKLSHRAYFLRSGEQMVRYSAAFVRWRKPPGVLCDHVAAHPASVRQYFCEESNKRKGNRFLARSYSIWLALFLARSLSPWERGRVRVFTMANPHSAK